MEKRILLLLSIILINIYYTICTDKSTKIYMKRIEGEREMRNLEYISCDNYIKVSFTEEEEEIEYSDGYDPYECRNSVCNIEVNNTPIWSPLESFTLYKGMEIKYCFNSSVTSLENFFSDSCDDYNYLIESIDLTHFKSDKLTKMNSMFFECWGLKSVSLNTLDTSSLVDVSELFYGCSSLEILGLNNFKTPKVTNMTSMFYGCSSLKSIDLSQFDTSSVTNMKSMFQGCEKLNSIDLSKFNTSLVKNMASMFDECSSLISIDLSKFNTSSVTDMNSMFHNCFALNSTILSNLDTSSVKDMSSMFQGCKNLISINLTNFDTSLVTNMNSMFDENLVILGISDLNFSEVKKGQFLEIISSSDSRKLRYIDIYNVTFKTSKWQTYFGDYFGGFINLTVCQPEKSQIIKGKNTKCCDFIIELGKCEPTNYISVNYSTEAKYENFNSNSRRGKVKYLNVTYGNSSKIIKPDEEFTIPANATVDIYLRYNVTNLDDFFA